MVATVALTRNGVAIGRASAKASAATSGRGQTTPCRADWQEHRDASLAFWICAETVCLCGYHGLSCMTAMSYETMIERLQSAGHGTSRYGGALRTKGASKCISIRRSRSATL